MHPSGGSARLIAMFARASLLLLFGMAGCASLLDLDTPDTAGGGDAAASSSGSEHESSSGSEPTSSSGAGSSGTGSSASSSSGSSGASSGSSGEPGDGGVLLGDLAYAAWPLPQATPTANDYAATADVVFDSVTKLTWQRGVSVGMSRAAAAEYCDVLSLGGHDDWRLPWRMELVSLLDVGGISSPRIQGTAFPDTPSEWFWTQSRAWAINTIIPQTWAVHFGTGHVSWQSNETETPFRVRCVRGMEQVSPVPLHWEVHDQTVRDKSTGLLWVRGVPQGFDTLANVALACQSLTRDGVTGFRVPNERELLSLIAEREPGGAGGLDAYAFPSGGSHPAWTVTPTIGSAEKMTVETSFGGPTNEADPAGENATVRCVK